MESNSGRMVTMSVCRPLHVQYDSLIVVGEIDGIYIWKGGSKIGEIEGNKYWLNGSRVGVCFIVLSLLPAIYSQGA
jgi:hypothetical protein